MSHRFVSFLRFCLLFVLIAGAIFQPQYGVYAATTLSIKPLTWNIIGLDSNTPASGPYRFPIGAEVCNTSGAPATVTVNFVWDDLLDLYTGDPYINLRSGSNSSITLAFTGNGCQDAYFEAEVNRVAAAFDKTRRYHITADDGMGGSDPVSTPQPRELYVEHLISQNRNAITDVRLNGVSVPAGGSMNLLVGNTYTIGLFGGTATQGYEQFEAFINFPNTIFQILSVSTTYSANTSIYVNSPNDKLYADACLWENDPNSPNYRACVGTPGKTGGSNVVTTYTIRIISGGGTTQTLNTLLYDFSGSSYHYNADYSLGARFANIIDPTNVTIAKSFSPNPGSVNGVSALTVSITNPNPGVISGYNFTDPLPTTPTQMVVATTPGAITTSCGTPTFAPLAGATSIAFTNGTIAANGTCTIKVNVTTTAAGTYNNTTNHLFVDTLDTGQSATAALTVNNAPATPAPICGLTMAQWTFAGFTVNPPPFPAANTQASNVTTAAISIGNGLTAEADTTTAGGNPQPGIRTYGWQNAGPIVTATSAYIQFAIDTSQYTQVNLLLDTQRKANGPNNDELYYSTDGTTWTLESTFTSTTSWATYGAFDFTGQTNATGITYFRVYGYGANATSSGNDFNLDNVTFTGCATPTPPTITKAFLTNPIAVNGTSTLRFTLSNSNSIALSGVTFTDTLPTGLQVAATPAAATTCGGTPTWAPGAGATSLTFGSPTGATIPVGSSCTVSVDITGTATGSYQNVSGFISSTNGGTNTSSTGSASASLSVISPPSIAKLFSPNPILANGTSTLTFTITNPNQNDALSGLSFTDTFPLAPGAMTVAAPLTTTNNCSVTPLQDNLGGTLASGDAGIRLTGGTLAGGSSCTITVNVIAPTVGSYANTSGAVASTNGGTGNTASDTLTVDSPNPAIALLKQISTSPTGPWSNYIIVAPATNVYYRFTLENSGDVPLSPVSVSDPTISGEESCAWPNTLPVADINDDDHIATCVVGPVVSVSGTITNTATGSGTFGGTSYTSTASSATYSSPAITLAKSVTETSFDNVGDTLSYSYLVTNSGFAPLLGPVTVTDDKATVTCPAVNTVGDLDDWFDPGESLTCTATYTITAADMTAALVTNTASASVSSVTSNESSVTVYRSLADLTVTKVNNVSGSVPQNGSFDWTITVTNSGIADAVFANTNLIMSDTLPGVAGYYPQGALTVLPGGTAPIGTIDCSITGTALGCVVSGGPVTLPVGGSFSVTFSVTPTAAGSLVNTATVDPDGNVLEISETNNTGSDTVNVLASPTISKSFGVAIIPVGGNTNLTVTIGNTNASAITLTSALTDTFPTGMTINTAGNTGTCTGVTATAGAGSFTIANGTSIPTGGCTVIVNVTSSTSGAAINTIPAGALQTNAGNNASSASATVNVVSVAKTIVSTSESSTSIVAGFERVAIGEIVRYRLTTLLPEGTWTNVQITDAIDTGIQFLNDGTAAISYVCEGTCSNSLFTITPAIFSSSTDPIFGLGTVTNPDADVNSEFLIVEFNALVLNMASNVAGGVTRNNSYTISFNGTPITSATVGVRVVEPSITNLAKTVSPAVGPYYPGDTITYTLTYSNGSTGVNRATAFDVFVTDILSGNLDLQSVSVVAPTGSAVTDTSTLGVGGVVRVLVDQVAPAVDIASGPTGVTISIVAQVVNTAPAGTLSNTANLTYTSLPGGVTTGASNGTCPNITGSCTPGTSGTTTGERNGTGVAPNTYVDVGTLDITVTPSADLSVTKTDGVTAVAPGGTTTYTIVVTNNGPSVVTGASITDTFPAGIASASWSCTASAGSACGAANGTGNIATTADLLVNGTVTFTVNANISASATGSLVNTVTVDTPLGTTDPDLSDNTAMDTDNVINIDAVNDAGSTVYGAVGGQSLLNVLTNDTLNGNPATLANVNLTQISTTNPGVTLDVTTGAVNVAPGTAAGNYTVTYQICDQANPTICDTATVTVPVVVIDAVNDTGSVVDGTAGGQAFVNVLTNDTLNGNPATLANVNLTQVSTTNPGVTLDLTTGTVNVAPGTPAGNYTVTYQICDQANPTICDTATVSVPVVVIDAVDDDFSSTPVNGYTGGNPGNAFTNDTLNGLAVTPAQIVATVTTPASDPGVTLNTTTGSVDVAVGTPAGTYTIDYGICDLANPTICDIATITVVVASPVINAVDDSATGVNGITGATAVLNVFDNDTLNGSAVVSSEVTLTETIPDPSGALMLNPDGSVDVAPGTAAGTYQLTYSLCEVLNPTNCDTAIVRVTVGMPPVPIAQDDSTTTPFNTPATLTNITANDTAFGTGNSIVVNTIDLDPSTPGQQTNFTDVDGNQWSVNITTGDVTFTPAANYTGTATIPYSVQDAAGQIATADLSVTVGPPASISGIVYNDADLNGTKSGSEPGIVGVIVNLYDSTGTTLIAAITTGPGGTYNFPNLPPGTYTVIETDPAGYVSSTPNSVSVTVSAGGTATADFGDYQLPNTQPSAIVGTVFNDANANGIQDAGELPLSGVTVQLRDNVGTVIATTTTNASGGYNFPNLNAGTYTVTETDPSGYSSTTLNNVAVNLSAGTTATINFGDQITGAAVIADPAVTKFGTPTSAVVGDIVVYTITVGNNGNTPAANVILTDTKPAFLDIISITISPNPGLSPVISGNTFTINFGTVTPTDFYTITVLTRVNSQGVPPGGANTVSLLVTNAPADRIFNNVSSAGLTITAPGGGTPNVAALPATGFAPNVVTDLSNVSRIEYAAVESVVLEIPSLGVKIPVVGVPKKNGVWDVTWLGKQAGWLEGTAFPSWKGNSVLTSHVYLANGLPGPFVNLGKLKYGDKIIVHAYGQKYTFEVSTNQVVGPNDTSALKHEEKPWLTLVTCKEYDEKTKTYKKRVVVRAILVSVEWDK